MKPRILSVARLSLPFASAIAALLASQAAHAQTTRTWSNDGTTNIPWLTVGNWTGGTNFAGGAPLANPTGEGATNDIMGFVTTNVGTTAGINMNTLAAAGGVGLSLGGIDFNRTSTAAFQIGNSSTTVNGIVQLNGATINSVANTLIRANSGNMTITNVATGATNGGQTLGLRLGITNGIFDVSSTRTLTIASVISQAAANSGFTKTGAGTLTLSGANSYSGNTTLGGGVITLGNNSALGSGALSFSGTGVRLVVNDGVSITNNITIGTNSAATGRGMIERQRHHRRHHHH